MAHPPYAMHPLDAVALDGFDLVSSAEVVLRHRRDRAWTILAVDADETPYLDAVVTHDVVQGYGPGEHRCTTVMQVDGRTICVRGSRRLLAHREVIEVRRFVEHDELVRTTFVPTRFGRTRMSVDVGVRMSGHRVVPAWTQPEDRCATAERRLAAATVR